MADITRAKERLAAEGLTCAVVGPRGEYTSRERGIRPVLTWLSGCPEVLRDASAADRVVGKAAALLFVRGRVREVYAEVISTPARAVLDRFGVSCTFQAEVARIRNRAGDGLCPMESRAMELEDPETAFQVFRELIQT